MWQLDAAVGCYTIYYIYGVLRWLPELIWVCTLVGIFIEVVAQLAYVIAELHGPELRIMIHFR